MVNEDKFANEMLTDDELDGVSGGGITDIIRDGYQMYLRGILKRDQVADADLITETLHGMGYTGYQNGVLEDNIYRDKNGNQLRGPEFWDTFGEETGAKIIKEREKTLSQGDLAIAYIKAW